MMTFRKTALAVVISTALACSVDPFPVELRIDAEGASNPTVAIGRDGTVLTAWVGTRQDTSDVFLVRITSDGQVGSPTRVNDVAGDAAPHEQAPAQVVTGLDGVVHVVWQTNTVIPGRRFPASDLRYARSTDGGRTFSAAMTVNSDSIGPPSSHTFHNVTANENGRVVVSWLDGRRADSIRAVQPGITEEQLPGSDIRIAVSDDGGLTFRTRTLVNENVCPCCRTSLALSPDGSIYVAWRKIFPGDIRDIVVAASRDGGKTFGEPVRVNNDGWVFPGCPHAGPDIAIDGSGELHATWYTGAKESAGLHHASSRDNGRTFGEPIALTGIQPPSQAKVAVGSAGDIWLAWERRDPVSGDQIVSEQLNPGRRKLRPSVLGAGRSPSLATAQGKRAVAWLEETGVVRIRIGET